MGHSRRRPFVGETPAGVGITYIPVEVFQANTNVQAIAVGTVTFTVDTTLENILYDTAAQAAVNLQGDSSRYVDPASAVFTNLIASGSVSATASVNDTPIFAVRINITAGTGSVRYAITQG